MTLTKKIKSIMLAAMEIAKAVSFAWMYKMIKIDMEMPDKCDECLFCTCPWDDFECVATGRGDIIDDVEGEKPYWCPLIEVK